jgi:hypothetical protein
MMCVAGFTQINAHDHAIVVNAGSSRQRVLNPSLHEKPRAAHNYDLPSGAKRMMMCSQGIENAVVNGAVTWEQARAGPGRGGRNAFPPLEVFASLDSSKLSA